MIHERFSATIQKFADLCGEFVQDSPQETSIIEVWNSFLLTILELAETRKEVGLIYESLPHRFIGIRMETARSARKPILKKWNELSLKEINEADSLEKFHEAYHGTNNADLRRKAKEKWDVMALNMALVAETPEELKYLYKYSLRRGLAREVILGKWKKLPVPESEKTYGRLFR